MALTPKTQGSVSPPDNLTEQAEGSVAVPANLTEQAVGSVAIPSNLTEQAAGSVAVPSNLTEQAAGSVAIPQNLTEQAVGSVAVPANLAESTVGSVAIPTNLAESTVGSVAVPANLTEQSVGSVAIPANLTEQAVGSVTIPTNLTEQSVSVLPRTIEPMLQLDFADNLYAQNGVAKALDDVLTYSRSSTATFWNRRINERGEYETFLDTDYVGSVTNLLTYSEAITDASWAKTGITVSSVNMPDKPEIVGDVSAVVSDATLNHYFSKSVTVVDATEYNISGYFKAGQAEWVVLYDSTTARGAYFNLNTGSIGTIFGTASDAKIEYIGNGWFKCSVTIISSGTTFALRIYTALNSSSTNYVGDNLAIDFYSSNIQLTESAKPLPYVKTLSTSASETFTEVPRLEYDPVTAQPLGYLAEGARTNLLLRSEDFLTTWILGGAATAQANQAIAPDGTKSMDRINAVTNTFDAIYQDVTLVANTQYTVSFYVKNIDSTGSRITLYDLVALGTEASLLFNWTGNTPSTQSVAGSTVNVNYRDCGNDIWRISFTGTTDAVNTSHRIYFYPENATGVGSVYLWGAQLELGEIASSYIRTEGVTVPRVADNLDGSATYFDESKGTVVIEADIIGTVSSPNFQYLASIDDGTSVDRNIFHVSSANAVSAVSVNTSVVQFSISSSPISENTSVTAVLTYQSNDVEFFVHGVSVGTDTDLVLPTGLNVINFGRSWNETSFMFGHIKRFITYDQVLTASEVSLL